MPVPRSSFVVDAIMMQRFLMRRGASRSFSSSSVRVVGATSGDGRPAKDHSTTPATSYISLGRYEPDSSDTRKMGVTNLTALFDFLLQKRDGFTMVRFYFFGVILTTGAHDLHVGRISSTALVVGSATWRLWRRKNPLRARPRSTRTK